MAKRPTLTGKQRAFIDHYLISFNATEAGRREAGRRQSAWGKVKVLWCGTFAVGFDCLCGEEDLQATDEEPTVCDECGREYRLGVWFTVESGIHVDGKTS